MKVPRIYRPIIKYVTPLLLLIVFLGALFTPKNNDWEKAFKEGWELDPTSIIGNITHQGMVANKEYVADYFEAEIDGVVSSITNARNKQIMAISNPVSGVVIKKYEFTPKQTITVGEGDVVQVSQKIAEGTFYNRVLYSDLSRLWLTALFIFIAWQVRRATNVRRLTGRIDE